MRGYATAFDPTLVTAREAARVVEGAAAIEKMAAAVKARAAARAAETGIWREGGDRNPAHELARRTGTSVGQARQTIETGRKLQGLPATAEAAQRGELSLEQAALVAGAASADPSSEQRLLKRSRSASLTELRDECARTRANTENLDARRERIHRQRRLRQWVDDGGVGHLHWSDNPERIADVMGKITPARDRLAEAARREGRDEPLEAHAADALHEVVCGRPGACPQRAGRRTTVLVRVDLDRLLGAPAHGASVCEIAGYGPVALSAVRDLLATGDPFLAAIVTKGEAITGVAHLGRRPTAHQRSALEWLYPTCGVRGCSTLSRLEIDHRDDWSKTHLTVLDLLDRLCDHHHRLKTHHSWALVEGTGKRPFVPPDDRRHPRHARQHRRPKPRKAA